MKITGFSPLITTNDSESAGKAFEASGFAIDVVCRGNNRDKGGQVQ